MEQVNFGYSLQNIPIPERKVYLQMLINSSEKLIRSVRWKAFFYLNPKMFANEKEYFGFTSTRPAPIMPELKEFEDEMLNLIKNVEFNNNSNNFQEKLKEDIKLIKAESKVFVAADKSSNFYKTEVEDYNKLLENNITKDYKKTNTEAFDKTNKEDAELTHNLDIHDRVFKTTERQCFVTIKDHKPNFKNNTKCRLLNPTKPNIGQLSKVYTERINNDVKKATNLNQWTKTESATTWFANLPTKHKQKFIQLDVWFYHRSVTR